MQILAVCLLGLAGLTVWSYVTVIIVQLVRHRGTSELGERTSYGVLAAGFVVAFCSAILGTRLSGAGFDDVLIIGFIFGWAACACITWLHATGSWRARLLVVTGVLAGLTGFGSAGLS